MACGRGTDSEQTKSFIPDSDKQVSLTDEQRIISFFKNNALISRKPNYYARNFDPAWLSDDLCAVKINDRLRHKKSIEKMFNQFSIIYYSSELMLEPAFEIECLLSGYIWADDGLKSVIELLSGRMASDIRIMYFSIIKGDTVLYSRGRSAF